MDATLVGVLSSGTSTQAKEGMLYSLIVRPTIAQSPSWPSLVAITSLVDGGVESELLGGRLSQESTAIAKWGTARSWRH